MSDELKKILQQLNELKVRSKTDNYREELHAMRELLFEAAEELAPVTLATLRHIATFKLKNDGVADDYVVTGKQIRDLFKFYDKSELLPKVQQKKS